jgi:hypothetical protein
MSVHDVAGSSQHSQEKKKEWQTHPQSEQPLKPPAYGSKKKEKKKSHSYCYPTLFLSPYSPLVFTVVVICLHALRGILLSVHNLCTYHYICNVTSSCLEVFLLSDLAWCPAFGFLLS